MLLSGGAGFDDLIGGANADELAAAAADPT